MRTSARKGEIPVMHSLSGTLRYINAIKDSNHNKKKKNKKHKCKNSQNKIIFLFLYDDDLNSLCIHVYIDLGLA